MKKILSLLAIALLVLFVIGCRPEPIKEPVQPPAPEPTPEPKPVEKPVEVPEAPDLDIDSIEQEESEIDISDLDALDQDLEELENFDYE